MDESSAFVAMSGGRVRARAPEAWPDLGVDLGGTFRPGLLPAGDPAGEASIHRYVSAGAHWLDCGEGRNVADVERRVGAAVARLPQADRVRVSTLLTGEPQDAGALRAGERPNPGAAGPLFAGGPDDAVRALEAAVHRSLRRLGRPRLDAVWLSAADAHALRDPSVRRVLSALTETGGASESWGVRFSAPVVDVEAVQFAVGAGASILALPMNLLNAPETRGLLHATSGAGVAVVAVDPFAGGLLDGSWWDESLRAPPQGQTAPPSWSQMRDAFEPVRRLAPLTTDRRRSLPAAALQYLWGTPGISGVLVRPRRPSEFDVAVGARSAPPLAPAERDLVERRGRDSPSLAGGVRLK